MPEPTSNSAEPTSNSVAAVLVGEQRFDRTVSNPPFVISPDASLLFRHSELPKDELSRLVVEGATAHLEEGGYAAILCNWVVPRGATR